MPVTREYLKGWNLQRGLLLGGFELVKINVGHTTVSRYQTYQYPSTLTWIRVSPDATVDELLRELNVYLEDEPVIYTSYGNPYRCDFGELNVQYEDLEGVIVEATGQCNRIPS